MTVKRTQRRGKNIESDSLRIVMIQRGLSYRDVAQMVGTVPQRVANVLCYSDHTWPIRRAINRALRKKIFRKPARRKPGPLARVTKNRI